MVATNKAPLSEDNVEEAILTGKHREKNKRIANSSLVLGLLFLVWCLYFQCLHPVATYFGYGIRNIKTTSKDNLLVNFDDIVPSEKLEWHSCYQSSYKCARLTVPMDYHRPLNALSSNPKVHIALVLIPGVHKGLKNFSSSPLLINPGGPGGSGVDFALFTGDNLHQVVGEDQDIIGFDPRGVGSSTPKADCFASFTENGEWDYVGGAFQRLIWSAAGKEIGLVNSSSDSLQKIDNRARAVAKLCQYTDFLLGRDSIFKYVNTPNVARDMLSIVDAWDEWTTSLESELPKTPDSATEIRNRLEPTGDSVNLDTHGKLVFWGFSYGSFLGATFASMFPDRVGRLVLDGVVDADYYVSPIWAESIIDADDNFNSFFKYCYQAGDKCQLHRTGDSIADIKERFQTVVTAIQKQPIVAINPLSNAPVILSYSDIKSLLFSTLYAPVQLFPIAAVLLDLLYRGVPQTVAYLSPQYDLQPLCGQPPPASSFPGEAQNAVMCLDKRYSLNETTPNLQARFEEMSNLSSWADVWMTLMIGCDAWGIEGVDPPMRWDDHPAHKQKPINTSFPILFVSNTLDPVTPLKAGVKMAGKFVGSGFVEQKSEGHCSIAAVSRCTIRKIQAYLNEGKVPPHPIKGGKGRELVDGKWDTCEADEWPFHSFDVDAYISANGKESMADVEAMLAFKEMQEEFKKLQFWGGNSLRVDPNIFQLL